MTRTRARLIGGLAAGLAASLVTMAPTPAHAAPVYTDIEFDPSVSHGQTGSCTDNTVAAVAPSPTQLIENGAPTTASISQTATYTSGGDPTDVMTNTASISGSGSATTAGGAPKSLNLSFTGSVTGTASKPAGSACKVYATAELQVDYEFTTTAPMWVTLNVTKKGPAYAEAWLRDADGGDPYEELYGYELDSTGSTTALLPAGKYAGYIQGEVYKSTNTTYSRAASGSVSLTFAPLGSAFKAPSGTAAKYVALPGARACATHNATATLTTKKKALKKVKKIAFTVNGAKAAALKGKKLKKGTAVALPLADDKAADITAIVTLKNGKKKTVDASYLACTS